MANMALLLLACLLAGAGFASMALSQKQHRSLMRGASKVPPTALRASGWILLGLAILPAISRDGVAFGLLLWVAVLTPSALAVVWWIAARSQQKD